MSSTLEHLGSTMKSRRLQLGLSAAAAAEIAGFNRATWGTAENAVRMPRAHNWVGIERALQWAPGSVAAVLDGGEPTEATAPLPRPSLVADEQVRAEVDRIMGLPFDRETRLKMLRAFIELQAGPANQAAGSIERMTG